jgi:beta-catenin-like protein 1
MQDSQQVRNSIFAFVKSLVQNDLLTLLVSNLSRLSETKEDEKQGIYNTISLIENLVEIDPSIADMIQGGTKLLDWLLNRINAKQFDSVRQYASELLEILVQSSLKTRTKLIELEAIDALLQVLARYRKKDPAEADEIEMLENIFNVLCLLLSELTSKAQFLKAEGFELMFLMLK